MAGHAARHLQVKLLWTCFALMVLAGLTGCASTPPSATMPGGPLDATYTFHGRRIPLTKGLFEKEAAPGSAAVERYSVFSGPAYGDLDGTGGTDAALIIAHSPGGSGTFYYVTAALGEDTGHRGLNTVLLGDRIVPEAVAINDRQVTISYLDREPSEPMAAPPTIKKRMRLNFIDGELVPEPAASGSSGGPQTPATLAHLTGKAWSLVHLYIEGEEISPVSPNVPTLAVNHEGRVSGLATVNRYFGNMAVQGDGRLGWMGPLGATMMTGPEEQMKQEKSFLKALQRCDRAFFRDGRLTLENRAGSVVLEFTR